ncbi:MAG: carboxypeptidase regulatory-like domain-containing protein [Candidatus Eremiobacteraeota bacterium]|nr:carboxypeptidase regulatory-like domain-containing protein [Candidatus Eremiobacteraeota bacterium]
MVLGLLAAGSLAACADPNFIGLQDYGTVNGNVVDQNGKPVPTAVVSVTGTTGIPFTTQTDGAFNLTNVAVGEQTITVNAAGYAPNNSTTVIVVKNQNATVGNVVIVSTVVGH